MTDNDQPIVADGDIDLFDNDDVEASGEQAPEDDQLSDAEIAGIRASQNDPNTSSPDAEAN